MSEDEQPELDPLVITITADVRSFEEAGRRIAARPIVHPAVQAAEDFERQMHLLLTPAASAPEALQRLKDGILRMGNDGTTA